MIASLEFIKKKFDEYNRLIFAGRLPEIPIRLVDAKSFLGQCVSKVHNLPDGRREHYDFFLKFSTRHDLPQQVVEDTIIHEMIHYFIMLHNLPDTSPHGQIFKSMMTAINRAYGRHLSVSHRAGNAESHGADVSSQTGKWHIIAYVTYRDGRTGIKVLPRVATRVIEYHKTVTRSPEIRSIALYLHNSAYFDRFPTSAALRVHILPRTEIESNLAGARQIRITSNGLSYADDKKF